MKHIALTTLLAALCVAPFTPAAAQDLLWTRQAGTPEAETGFGLAVDGQGNAYITGYTWGNLGGQNAGRSDAFVAKYDASGAVLWTRQFGTPSDDVATSVVVDSLGNAYIGGHTLGSLGGPNVGRDDCFLAKFDTLGNLLWTRQIGTPSIDRAFGAAVDSSGNAYISGDTRGSLGGPNAGDSDAFVAKFDTSGNLLWTRQIGTPLDDRAWGAAVDSTGNAYISGDTRGSLGGPNAGNWDAFVAKFGASGNPLWTRQIGTSRLDGAVGVAVDSADNAYITGNTLGSLGGPYAGGWDAFVAKFAASGNALWTRQVGMSMTDLAAGVAVDSTGNAYIAGYTDGTLGGSSAGSTDAFLIKYDTSGARLWTRQTGTADEEQCSGVAVDSAGNAYFTGATNGSVGGPNAGDYDVFLVKFGEALCYADCDKSTGNGVLDVFDFLCFQNSFVNGETYACDCDTSTGPGVCDVFDFLCFQDAFVGGCP